MAKRKGHWVFVHWKRVQGKGTGAGQWLWKRVWRPWKPKPKPAPKPTPAPTPTPTPPPKPKPKPTVVFMYDDTNVSLIPRTARAAAGYVDGRWQTYLKLKIRCPLAKLVAIAVFPHDDADVLDVEPGDATNAQAPAWVKRQLARRRAGVKYATRLPVVYTSASNGPALIAVLTKAGLKYGVDYLWWSAHYDPKWGVHLCHPGCYPGVDHVAHATQYTDHADNKNLDESIVGAGFFA